jgi:hypothetical protein
MILSNLMQCTYSHTNLGLCVYTCLHPFYYVRIAFLFLWDFVCFLLFLVHSLVIVDTNLGEIIQVFFLNVRLPSPVSTMK